MSGGDSVFFFVKEGIIIFLNKPNNPLLDFEKTINKLPLNIKESCFYQGKQAVFCETSINSEELFNLGYKVYPVKYFLSQVGEDLRAQLLQIYQALNWHKQSKYCGQCGTKLNSRKNCSRKYCPVCGVSFFPRFSPAIIVLIQKNDQILLARSSHFPKGMYSALAGFVDLGESAEEALHREVKEEVGLTVNKIEYFATQSWPFPDSFMIAFKAQYLDGEISIDPQEIEDAAWFDLDKLPQLPSYASISRRLIDSVISGSMAHPVVRGKN